MRYRIASGLNVLCIQNNIIQCFKVDKINVNLTLSGDSVDLSSLDDGAGDAGDGGIRQLATVMERIDEALRL